MAVAVFLFFVVFLIICVRTILTGGAQQTLTFFSCAGPQNEC